MVIIKEIINKTVCTSAQTRKQPTRSIDDIVQFTSFSEITTFSNRLCSISECFINYSQLNPFQLSSKFVRNARRTLVLLADSYGLKYGSVTHRTLRMHGKILDLMWIDIIRRIPNMKHYFKLRCSRQLSWRLSHKVLST